MTKEKTEWIINKIEQRAGWIVGFGTIYNGNTILDLDSSYYFNKTKTLKIIKISFTPNSKPVNVPYDGIVAYGGIPDFREYEWHWHDNEIINQYKKDLSDEMKDWPRNEKGRWIKKEK